MLNIKDLVLTPAPKSYKHPSCRGSGEDCGYETTISCDDCKYGGCRGLRSGKDPEAKCNQPKET